MYVISITNCLYQSFEIGSNGEIMEGISHINNIGLQSTLHQDTITRDDVAKAVQSMLHHDCDLSGSDLVEEERHFSLYRMENENHESDPEAKKGYMAAYYVDVFERVLPCDL
ncbi:hypothetical protein Goe16_02130 [Bacillus phage vB_BsuM-Goe16]|nr:hypothetical protein Goe16_00190 [Bacillus phage vB_BsuM-Goe16]WCS68627.1 hypothetical protein Goe16_02130 [Bacillus phage vB_BsuM-Goe16]